MSRRVRLANVPVPRSHVLGLLVGGYLHRQRPIGLPGPRSLVRVAGVLLVLWGVSTALRAVRVAGRTRVEYPDRVLETGPYATRRHPMYVGWTAIYLGIVCLANAAWMLVPLPIVLVVTGTVARVEEHELERQFGREYRAYADRTPRYL